MMDSREMYNSTNYLLSLVVWDSEWIHFGTDNQIKYDLVLTLIENYLTDAEILLIHERTTSRKINKQEIREVIKDMLGKDDFQLWTTSLDKVIKFSKIGVLNIGRR